MNKPTWRKKFAAAFNGIYLGLSQEKSFKVHVLASIIVIAAGSYFQVTSTEWCLLTIAMMSVLAMELMNSAVERLAKVITRETNPMIGAALNLAAGAVLIATFGSVAIGLIIFLPRILNLISIR